MELLSEYEGMFFNILVSYNVFYLFDVGVQGGFLRTVIGIEFICEVVEERIQAKDRSWKSTQTGEK